MSLNEDNNMGVSEIQKFYKDCNVFVTGGTGFLGKILIEKLLRSTEVNTIYILIREKKGKNMTTRMDELFDDIIFERLKRECPKFKSRVSGISGDCSMAGLGLTIVDKEKITANTHIIFHVAATVKFDENLKLAYSINVQSAGDVLDLSRHMKQLKAMMHVSTAYSHCYLYEVDEKFYDCPDYEAIGNALEKLSKNEAQDITKSILGKWPNTYTFTKALAESLIKARGKGIPVGVYRPAIVISTSKEPIPGWIDNMYGPTGVCAGVASGVIRVICCDRHKNADLVPVDTCVAGLIASAKDVHDRFNTPDRTPDDIPVYNYVSSAENPITWGEFNLLNIVHGLRYSLSQTLWTINFRTTSNQHIFWFYKIFLHYLPALVIDFGSVMVGRPFRLLPTYKKVHKLSDILMYFCLRDWKFSNDNVVKLWGQMNETDKELFPLSMANVNWLIFFKEYIKGMRQYLLRDPLSTLEAARRRCKRFQLIQSVMSLLFHIMLSYSIWTILSKVFSSVLGIL